MWNLTNILLGVLILQIAFYACMYVVWRYKQDKIIVERLSDIYYQVDWIKDKMREIYYKIGEKND